MDTRGERTHDRVLSEVQMNDLKTWLTNPEKKDQIKFLVSAVPFVLQTVDANDKWSADRYYQQRDEILKMIVDNDVDNVVILTGDVHNACHCSVDVTVNEKKKTIHEFTAGPISQQQIRAAKYYKPGKHKLRSSEGIDLQYQLFEHMGLKRNKKKNRYKVKHNAVMFEMRRDRLVYRVYELGKARVVFEGR